MAILDFSLITGRTIEQGTGKEHGKLSGDYFNSVAICEMSPEDMKTLKIQDNDAVKVATKYGSVVVRAKRSKRFPSPGMIFIPYGPWANSVMAPETEGTGMPLLKGVQASVEPTDEKVLRLPDLIVHAYGKEE